MISGTPGTIYNAQAKSGCQGVDETAANLYFAEKHKSGNWTGQKGEGWEEYLQHYPKVPKQLQEKNQNYTVNIKENGEIQVSPGLESLDNEGN